MKINVKTTKVKKISKRPGEEFTIFLEGKQLSQESSHFNYLGSFITQDQERIKGTEKTSIIYVLFHR